MTVKFRRRPAVVDALLFTGRNDPDVADFVGQNGYDPDDTHPSWMIKTAEGEMTAQPGDWIVRDTNGEFRPVKPHIFEAMYEPLDGPQSSHIDELERQHARDLDFFADNADEYFAMARNARDALLTLAAAIQEVIKGTDVADPRLRLLLEKAEKLAQEPVGVAK